MNKKQKEEQYKLFAEAFHEVVVPELQQMKEDLSDVKDIVFKIENKLSKVDDRLDRQGKTQDNYGRRIEILEHKAGIASNLV